MSSDDDEAIHPPEPDAPVDRKVLATDDTGDAGTISAKALVPGPIGAGAPSNPRPLPLIGSPLFHLQAIIARNAYTLP
jgi:hypothetical protein